MKAITNIFLVDDHQMFLDGIFSILNESEAYNIVGTAKDGEQVLKILANFNVDIVITDIEMPKLDGLELTKIVKERFSNIKVLIASSHAQSDKIKTAINSGADGYLIKNAGKVELLKALKTISKGETYFSAEIEAILRDSLLESKKEEIKQISLSPREKKVLCLIAKEKSTQEITELLFISKNTVETHRKNMMRKIGAKNMIGLVKYAIEKQLI